MEYYIQIFDKAFGPLTQERIHRLLELKKINGSTIVSKDGENWQTLESFPELINIRPSSSNAARPSKHESSLWNYSLDGIESVGPIPFDEIYSLAQSGFLNPDTVVWKEGANESAVLRDVQEFSDLFSSGGKQSKAFDGLMEYVKSLLNFVHSFFNKFNHNSTEVDNGC